ncbi:retrovirus-related pol polyprotein from transposon TNT 1-94 [Tanacetum coccineum]
MIPQVHSPQSYSSMYPPPHLSQPQISHLSIPPSQQYQSHIGLDVPVFNQGDDLISCLNKEMAFLTIIASSRVTVQQVQGRQGQSYVDTIYKGNATSSRGNNAGGQKRVVKCYNFQGEGHMARQRTQPKRPRNAAERLPSFKEKVLLAVKGQAAQTTILNTAAFQTEDLDAYDSDCDDVSNAKAVLMANLSNYGNRSQLMNFVSKFLGTVRFGNDQIAKIIGYGDYQLRNAIVSRDPEIQTCTQFPICLLLKASKTKSWLWNHRLSHLNFGTLTKLAKDGLARGIPKLKFKKDHLSKDEAPDAIIKYIKNIPVHLNVIVRNVKTYNGTQFVNQTLCEFYENVGISHQTSVARTPQQNGVVKRRNQTLVEAVRTMLIFSKASLYLWAEAINTACYTQNRSLIRLRYSKTRYELMHDKKPDLSFLYVFGSLCYPTNDIEDLGKLNTKANIGIFVGYTPEKKAFRIYNRRT